jgi:hypothetical protein
MSSESSGQGRRRLGRLLAFSAATEIATGLALMLAPRIVVTLLIGNKEPLDEMPLARVAGIALFAFGIACWPSQHPVASGSPGFRAMLVYNALIALYLAYLFMIGHLGGLLLWPAVLLHAVVALLLIWHWRSGPQTRVGQ